MEYLLILINIIVFIILLRLIFGVGRVAKPKRSIKLADDQEVFDYMTDLINQLTIKKSKNIPGHIFEVKVPIAYNELFMMSLIGTASVFNFQIKELFENDSTVKLELVFNKDFEEPS